MLQAPIHSDVVPDLGQSAAVSVQKHHSPIKAFQRLFENAPPVPPDFDPDQAKWDYLKEKHDL